MKTIPNGAFKIFFKVMQVANTGILVKTNVAVSSAIRNTSCSRGWLRLVVQTIFGLITVSSFIMIMILALQRDPNEDGNVGNNRCSTSSCRVVCSGTPSYEDFVNDIIATLTDVEPHCENGISLSLHRPRFINSTMPRHWMSQVQSKVTELNIVGGNLVCIEQDAFMSTFASNINHLGLVEISLAHVNADHFVGLSSLQVLDIRDSDIGSIHRNALRPVADTLKELNIRNSKYWNPANLTGTSELNRLVDVDFSSNTFFSVLGRESFRQLDHCEVLRLSSSRIISIGAAAFDFMVRIQRIYINNNFLVSLPANIFDRVTALAFPRPAIDLQDNLWRCDCYNDHLRQLQAENYLMVDPTCRTPYELNGRAFSSFETFCCENRLCIFNKENDLYTDVYIRAKNMNLSNELFLEDYNERSLDSLYIDGACKSFSLPHEIEDQYKCKTNRARYLNYEILFNVSEEANTNNDRLRLNFFVEKLNTSLLELRINNVTGYDLIWFQSKCLSDVFCVNSVPNFLRLYNVNKNSSYTFCTVDKSEGILLANNCLTYSYRESRFPITSTPRGVLYVYILIYVSTIAVSAVLGGICLYALIRRNPALLRGSKRILLVKHKAVDALVLPPRIPLRASRENSWNSLNSSTSKWKSTNDSVVTKRHSITSGNSSSPSYISALQPTEAQLAEWRLKRHFSNDTTVSSNQFGSLPIDSNLVSYIYDGDSLFYPVNKINNVENKYEIQLLN